MKRVPLLSFAFMIVVMNCAYVTAEPSELESLRTSMDMMDLRLSYEVLKLRRDLETERRLRIELQSTLHQLQEQKSTTNHTKSPEGTDNLSADVKSQKDIIEQIQKDIYNTHNMNQMLKNDNTRLQNENNDLRHDIVVLQKAFGKEKQSRKQMEKISSGLRSKHEELLLELRKASDQGDELKLFKSSTETALTRLRSNMHHIERNQNELNSSALTVKHKLDAYIDGVSNEVCKVNPRFTDICQRHDISKSRCCLKEALQFVQESLKGNDQKISDLKKQLNFRVSFSAQISTTIEHINPDDTIVFSDVINNDGSAYNPTNGKFVAPVGGTYVFFSHILGPPRTLETALMINNHIKLHLYSGDPEYLAPGSNMLVIRMSKWDSARMIKHGSWGDRPFYIHHRFSTFSGFLLSAG